LGYTHYYKILEDIDIKTFANFARDASKIINDQRDILADHRGQGSPIVRECEILLNGIGDDSCESFIVNRDKSSEFCKTRRLPYDDVVTAILILLDDHLLSKAEISSDGNFHDWQAGIELYEKVMRRPCGKRYWLHGEDEDDN
jgi:hypothetical protein